VRQLTCWCTPLSHSNQRILHVREVTGGWATLDEFEKQPTKTEGIFVMPKEPILIQSTYVYTVGGGAASSDDACEAKLAGMQIRLNSLAAELQNIRAGKLPN